MAVRSERQVWTSRPREKLTKSDRVPVGGQLLSLWKSRVSRISESRRLVQTEQPHRLLLSVAWLRMFHELDTERVRQTEPCEVPRPSHRAQSPSPSVEMQYGSPQKSLRRLLNFLVTNQPVVMCSQPHRLKIRIRCQIRFLDGSRKLAWSETQSH